MVWLIQFLLTLVATSVRLRLFLQAENAALRNQLILFGLSPVYKELFQISHRFEFTCS